MTVNKITKKEYPTLWDTIVEDEFESEKDHRKYSSFFIALYYEIDEEIAPDNPEIWGTWKTTEQLISNVTSAISKIDQCFFLIQYFKSLSAVSKFV